MLTDRIIVLSWALFCGYWAVSSLAAKMSTGRIARVRRYLPVLLLLPAVSLAMLAFESEKFPHHGSPGIGLRIAGTVLCGLGVAIAIWARTCLGDNWGMPMTRREAPQLVTKGPYACVRHPIYTGILLGIVGTSLATSPGMLLGWTAAAFLYFWISSIKEEQDMLRAFPEQYRAYMSRTRRLIPFIW